MCAVREATTYTATSPPPVFSAEPRADAIPDAQLLLLQRAVGPQSAAPSRPQFEKCISEKVT